MHDIAMVARSVFLMLSPSVPRVCAGTSSVSERPLGARGSRPQVG